MAELDLILAEPDPEPDTGDIADQDVTGPLVAAPGDLFACARHFTMGADARGFQRSARPAGIIRRRGARPRVLTARAAVQAPKSMRPATRSACLSASLCRPVTVAMQSLLKSDCRSAPGPRDCRHGS